MLSKYGRLFLQTFGGTYSLHIQADCNVQVYDEAMGLNNKLSARQEVLREGRIGYWTRPEPVIVYNFESCSCVLVFDTSGPGDSTAEHRNVISKGNKLVLTGRINLLMLT